MTDHQNAFFQMGAAVKVVCDTFNADWAGTPSFATPHGLLLSNVLGKQPGAAAKQQRSSAGVSASKKAARTGLANHLQSLAAAIEAFALSSANETLRDDAHLTASDTVHATDDELLGMEKRISGLATANLASLAPFGVTTARITALDAEATGFAAFIGQPRAMRAISKDGTGEIEALVDLGRTYLEAMDGQMILFKEMAPDFYSQYFTARKLVPTGSRPRAIYFTVRDQASGKGLPGVVIKIPELSIIKVTSANGTCFVQSAAPGNYEAMFTCNGYGPLETTAHVNDGLTEHVDVAMTMQP